MRKSTKKIDIIIIIVLVLLVIGGFVLARLPSGDSTLNGFMSADTDKDGSVTYKDYIGRRIGIITGTNFETPTMENFPDSGYFYFNSYSDISTALLQNMIDGFLGDEPALRIMRSEQPEIGYLRDMITHDSYAFGFPKDSERSDTIRRQFNEMLEELSADGTLAQMEATWFGNDESKKVVDLTGFTGENGTLKVVTNSTDVPFSYIKDNKNVGFSIDLVEKFCRKYGYTPEIEDVDFAARIPGLVSGKYDMCASSLTMTEERKESVDFSDPIYNGGITLAVRASELGETSEVVEDRTFSYYAESKKIGALKDSLYEALIRERYPEAEPVLYDDMTEMSAALSALKIEAFTCPESTAKQLLKDDQTLTYLNEVFADIQYGFAFEKSAEKEQLRDRMNEYLKKIRSDGSYNVLIRKWFGSDESKKTVDISGLTGENGNIRYVTTLTMPPFSYVADEQDVGLEIDIVAGFCREYGYSLDIESAEFASLIPGVKSGKYDIASGTIMITEERAKSVNFSDAYYTENVVTVVKQESSELQRVKDLEEIAILTGSVYDSMLPKICPDADLSYYDSYPDMLLALKSGIIDSFVADDVYLKYVSAEDDSIAYISHLLDFTRVSSVFSDTEKGKKLCAEFNKFLKKITDNGMLDQLKKLWIESEESQKTIPDYDGLDSRNGFVNLATEAAYAPMVYVKDGQVVGFEIALIYEFCKDSGYGLKITDMSFESIIPAVHTGKYDMGASGLIGTEERSESLLFSDPYYDIYGAFAIISKAPEKNGVIAFFKSIGESFEKNFIRENRWQLIVQGIGTTCLITVLSAIFGSLLAFLICMFRRTGSVVANVISNIFVKLMQGTPLVVLLMILYYVVFGKSGLESIWVAIIGFSFNFGAYGSEIMRSGIDSIDGGQREAALALGYSENQAFFRFIFPQAAARFIPVYLQEIISLLKSTSIVGYIAIQDLTKMSDIIRSRTYEAFFPLIVTAIIYFILAWILTLILKLIFRRFDSRRKRDEAAK